MTHKVKGDLRCFTRNRYQIKHGMPYPLQYIAPDGVHVDLNHCTLLVALQNGTLCDLLTLAALEQKAAHTLSKLATFQICFQLLFKP